MTLHLAFARISLVKIYNLKLLKYGQVLQKKSNTDLKGIKIAMNSFSKFFEVYLMMLF